MKRPTEIGFAALALALLVFCAGCAVAPSKDSLLHERLVGKWSRVFNIGEWRLEDATELARDGTLRVQGVLHQASGSRAYVATGSWRVQDGNFVYIIHTSNFPGWKPTSEVSRRILSVSEWEWVMEENAAGAERRAWRFPK